MRKVLWSVLCVTALAVGCSKDPQVAKREFLRSADEYAAHGKYSEAVVQYRNAIQQDPRYGEARLRLGDTYAKLGDAPKSYQEYIRAADLLPDSLDAQVKASKVLLLVQQYEDAQHRAEKAIAIDPQNIDALIVRANALAGLKRTDEALSEAEKAVSLQPDREDHLGLAYAKNGDLQLVRTTLQSALKSNQDAAQAAEAKAVLSRLGA